MTVHKIINKLQNLSPFPATAFQLVEIVANENRARSEVADIVKTDANLATNVLRLANSAMFGTRQQVDSIERAVAMLGAQLILEIALISMTAPLFKGAHNGYDLEDGELWRHAMASALFARETAREHKMKTVDAVFTAGLIKDVGKVIMNRYMAEAAIKINDLVYRHNYPFFEAEIKVLGLDHAELGALVFEKWRFPENLVMITRNHHLQKTPVVAPRETCAVFLGDTICSMLGIGAGKDGLCYPFDAAHLTRYFDMRSFDATVASRCADLEKFTALAASV